MSKIISHKVELQLAKKTDLLHAAGLLKFGTIYYLKHSKTHLLSGPYVLDKFHNSTKLKDYFQSNSIYVPLVDFDFDINNNLQQVDFKIQMSYE
ncbi:hypothetical protein ES692_06010 [Psychroserpens burtonensis]|uniref:Uncharacterized protein n=1 Tax=Psychroserpens burtonensis TaxID=49278 RepID=A0A5C7BGK9_9FLAO|nr:hypothetical protein [Psychroserpens burtonensis]TXE18595.1 hypothetical protein ES692_06010 [Psychroserpens burtonensis]